MLSLLLERTEKYLRERKASLSHVLRVLLIVSRELKIVRAQLQIAKWRKT